MKNIFLTSLFLLIFVSAGFAQFSIVPVGAVLTVNNTGESNDARKGDGFCADAAGQCTLRAAIEESNAHIGMDYIIFALPNPSVINLTLGELRLTSSAVIIGTGARRLTVQRSAAAGTLNFRIFNLMANSGVYTIRNLKIRNGAAGASFGGGVNVETGNIVTLSDLAVVENTAAGGGGIANTGNLTIVRSLVANNAGNTGGGFINASGLASATISGSTVTLNNGGGLENLGRLVLANATISDNTFNGAANGITAFSNSTTYVVNTIIKGAGTLPLISGDFTSVGNNIVTNSQGGTGFVNGTNNDQVSDNGSLDPKLGDLANNGGQTDTRALLAGSPAIDRGNLCVTNSACGIPNQRFLGLRSDQRAGYARTVNGTPDIGAFEYNAPPPFTGFAAVGIFSLSSRPLLSLNSLLIITSTTTGEKRFGITKADGHFTSGALPLGDIYIYEIRGKRAGTSNIFEIDLQDRFIGIPFLTEQTQETDDHLYGIRISAASQKN